MDASLVSTEYLAEHLGAPDLVVIDATWFLPDAGKTGREEYDQAHIPGAVFFDIDHIADRDSHLPHMLPAAEQFAAEVSALGIHDGDRIVVYDHHGLFSAARVWWTFRVMGATRVAVLDGGLPKWQAEGRPTTTEVPARAPATFNARLDGDAVASLDSVRHALETGASQIVDARPAARFHGEAPEPRAGLRAGHMPGSHNLPIDRLVAGGALRQVGDLREAFEGAGVDLSRPVVTSCGSGVAAAILTLALDQLGIQAAGLYDGSWTEWGGHATTPVHNPADG